MSKLLKDVLIKISRGGVIDRVLFIDNVPEDMFYEMKHPKKIVGEGQQQHWVPDTSKPKEPTLYEELKRSKTGDNAIVFNMEKIQAQERYKTLERYIKSVYPNNKAVPQAVPYAKDPSSARSEVLALSQVPRVELPVLSPSGSKPDADSSTADFAAIKASLKAELMAELEQDKKEKTKERMAKARAARASK